MIWETGRTIQVVAEIKNIGKLGISKTDWIQAEQERPASKEMLLSGNKRKLYDTPKNPAEKYSKPE